MPDLVIDFTDTESAGVQFITGPDVKPCWWDAMMDPCADMTTHEESADPEDFDS